MDGSWACVCRVQCSEGSTDQALARVSPVKVDAHVELSTGGTAEYQPLPHRQPDMSRGQREVIDLVSWGKGRRAEWTGVAGAMVWR